MKTAVIFTGLVKIDKNLVGTAVIYKKIAELLLSAGYRVKMVVPELPEEEIKNIELYQYEDKNNRKLVRQCALAVFGAYPPVEPLYYAYQQKKRILTYLWSIAPIGSLEFKDFANPKKQRELHCYISASYNLSLLLSDKIFCRSEQARNLILGSLASLGRISPDNYRRDRSLRRLVETAPFGLDQSAPKPRRNVYRGLIDGIGEKDFILLWNGGIWNWNDGETLVKAMELVKSKYKQDKIKLIFQGFRHPDKSQKLSVEAKKTLSLARKLKLADKNIYFSEQWIPFAERGGYLTECDAGIVSSPDIPEANLFLKTRIYDYLWAELPVVLGDNEAFAPYIRKHGLGEVAACGDPADFARQIIKLSAKGSGYKQIKANIKAVKKDLAWDKNLAPLKKYLKHRPRTGPGRPGTIAAQNIKHNLQIIRSAKI